MNYPEDIIKRLLSMLFLTHSLIGMANLTPDSIELLKYCDPLWETLYLEYHRHMKQCISTQTFQDLNTIAYKLSLAQYGAYQASEYLENDKIDARRGNCPITQSEDAREPGLKNDVQDMTQRHIIHLSHIQSGN